MQAFLFCYKLMSGTIDITFQTLVTPVVVTCRYVTDGITCKLIFPTTVITVTTAGLIVSDPLPAQFRPTHLVYSMGGHQNTEEQIRITFTVNGELLLSDSAQATDIFTMAAHSIQGFIYEYTLL